MIYDFTKGKAATLLHKEFEVSFDSSEAILPLLDIKVDFQKIKIDQNGYYTYSVDENDYLMLAYKESSWIKKNGLPKYHIYECDTRMEHNGYIFSNKMPVDVKCAQTGEKHNQKHLRLCKNCSHKSSTNFWSSGQKPWYENVLDYVEKNQNHLAVRRDKYLRMWQQVSEAFREKMQYKCNQCKIDLSLRENRYYLHVHHKDGKKDNNSQKNFECLCILCHTMKHAHTHNDYSWVNNVNKFISLNRADIERLNRNYLNQWKAITEKYYHKFF